ncbi:hypothetical protein ASG47_19760 [Devosia sp. Leaf420]|uniref:hypothetical protein n=1 Tax=Devosia sp. Leaf420 TaxID=1736374 RepID=UPI000712B65B|nr:hypothetical protein [Devosia sp. Leaf420]KQT50342.1 hypothetical protein ASG47_19760 [Devosia sp. Leaf420]
MNQHFGVFDAESGALLSAFSTNDLHQVGIQSQMNRQVVLEGDFSQGHWRIGPDGWPESFEPIVVVTADEVKALAARLLRETDWQVTRHRDEVDAAQPTSLTAEAYAGLLDARQAIRDASNRIEAMDPIPADFRNPSYWSAS